MAQAPAVFNLDIGLADMDGYELARRLRAMPDAAGALLVALTRYGQGLDLVLSRQAGFDYHFIKPLDMPAFRAVLASLPR